MRLSLSEKIPISLLVVITAFSACTKKASNFRGFASVGNTVASNQLIYPSTAMLRTTDSNFVAGVITQAYGLPPVPTQVWAQNSSGTNDPLINIHSQANLGQFGNPCDWYEVVANPAFATFNDSFSQTPSTADSCWNTYLGNRAGLQAQMLPPTTSARMALVTRTCNAINVVDANIQSAVSALGTPYSITNYPDANAINAVYAQFYQGKTPSADVIASLQNVVKTAQNYDSGSLPIEGWRYLFWTLCLAPDWQVP